jgi:phage terminase large subunit
MATLEIPTPEVYEPFLQPSRYKGAWGGRGSAKSHEFAGLTIEYALLHQPARIVCVREIQKSLDQSVKRLLEDKISAFNVGHYFRVMNTHIETPKDGVIIFQGMQNHTKESIKSLEGFDVAWVEEAQSLSQGSLDLLRPTIRKPNSEIWATWNPRHPKDPIDRFLRGPDAPKDAIVIGSTYRDNPWFPDVLRREMEYDRDHDPEKYRHIWLGEYEKKSESRVFKNWRVEEFETPAGTTFYYGADWGYAVDPTTLIRLWVKPKTLTERGTIFIDREKYKIGVEIDHTPAFFDTLDDRQARLWPIIADSARPETISYLRRNGYPRIEAAKKGPNSVKEGVIFLQGFDIVIHPRCTHTIDEFTAYSYKTDEQTGEVILPTVLEDKKNHIIDPVRYAIERLRKPQMRVITIDGF